jgi:hypothetical protein
MRPRKRSTRATSSSSSEKSAACYRVDFADLCR